MNIKPLDYLRAVLDDRELSPVERLVAIAIMRHAGSDGTKSHPGTKLLMAETGYGETKVMKAVVSLREKGWVIQTYNGRGGAHNKASEYDLSIPNRTMCGLNTDQMESQTVLSDSQTVHVYGTDAFIPDAPLTSKTARKRRRQITSDDLGLSPRATKPSSAPSNSPAPAQQVPAIKKTTAKENDMITQEDIDYRDLAKKGFSESLGEDFHVGLDALFNLQRVWPDASAIPFDHIAAGCFSWKQFQQIASGASLSDVGINSLAAIVGHHLKTNDDLMALAMKGFAQIGRYELGDYDSGYDPRRDSEWAA